MRALLIGTFLMFSSAAQAIQCLNCGTLRSSGELSKITIHEAPSVFDEDSQTEAQVMLANVRVPRLPPNQPTRPGQPPQSGPPQAAPAQPARPAPAQPPRPALPQGNCDQGDQTQINMCRYFNQWRRQQGLPELTIDPRLNQVAQAYAQVLWQAEQQGIQLSHELDGQLSDRVVRAGIRYRDIGENIARGQQTIEQAFYSWETSTSGHYEAMISTVYTRQGFGWYNGNWVHLFLLE